MSVKILGEIWELELEPVAKLVALAFGDHADHEGENVYPSLGLVAWKTGLHIRTVREHCSRLRELGLLVVREEGRTGPDGGTLPTRYAISLEGLTRLPPRQKGGVGSTARGGSGPGAGGGRVHDPTNRQLGVVDEKAREALEQSIAAAILTPPAAEALTHYLEARVPAARQRAYVLRVCGWVTMDPWRCADGSTVPSEERAALLADTILGLSATDEAEGYSRPVGDPDNLHTRLNIALSNRNAPPYERPVSAPGRTRAAPGGDAPLESIGAAMERTEAARRRVEEEVQRAAESRARLDLWKSQHPEKLRELEVEVEAELKAKGIPVRAAVVTGMVRAKITHLLGATQ